MDGYAESETFKSVARLVTLATVKSVDLAAAKATVEFSKGTESATLPWITMRAGKVETWSAPAVGEQVVCVSPGGDTARAVIVGSLYSASKPPVSNQEEEFYMKIGLSEMIMTADSITLQSGPSSLVIDQTGVRVVAPRVDLN